MRAHRFFACTILFALFLVAAPAALAGDHQTFGLGIVLGEPTGVTAKYFLSPNGALDFDLAFSLIESHLWFSTDYLYHFGDLAPGAPGVLLRPYIGGGGIIAGRDRDDDDHDRDDDDEFGLAGRFTGGLSSLFTEVHLELFIDGSVGVWIVPETDLNLGAVIGLRYFF